jgi:uncharacterized repeat protein (TIGR01451 family)
MRFLKLFLAGAFALALFSSAILTRSSYAQTAPTLMCDFEVIPEGAICDLSIKKEVNVNGGTFSDANTSGAAVQASVGDNLIWKISVTNNSTLGGDPIGTVTVSDVLPSNVSYLSSTPSDGTYDNTTGKWQFSLPPANDYPVTLTINSTATSSGLAKNTAAFSEYTQPQCESDCTSGYTDGDPANNIDDAFANVSARPQVLAASTLLNTGSGMTESLIAGSLIVATAFVAGYNRIFAKDRAYKLYR